MSVKTVNFWERNLIKKAHRIDPSASGATCVVYNKVKQTNLGQKSQVEASQKMCVDPNFLPLRRTSAYYLTYLELFPEHATCRWMHF